MMLHESGLWPTKDWAENTRSWTAFIKFLIVTIVRVLQNFVVCGLRGEKVVNKRFEKSGRIRFDFFDAELLPNSKRPRGDLKFEYGSPLESVSREYHQLSQRSGHIISFLAIFIITLALPP